MFFPTYIKDTHSWEGAGGDCGAGAKAACEQAGGDWYLASQHSCTCSRREDFFAKNPEQQQIALLHGYEIKREPTSLDEKLTAPNDEIIESGRINRDSDNILTKIKAWD